MNNEIRFPFLGSKEDGDPFEYLLLSSKPTSAEITIPEWLMHRTNLHFLEKVELHIPYQKKDNFGTVTLQEKDIYKIEFSNNLENKMEPFSVTLVLQLLKDTLLLKSGIKVYFKHLIPYFSRIVNFSEKDYITLKKHLLTDIMKHIQANESHLQEIYTSIEKKLTKLDELSIHLDLEELRSCLESEISLPLFNMVFAETSLDLLGQYQVQNQFAYSRYLIAMKQLEKRLFFNYNLIVLIYSSSLTGAVA